MRGVGRLAVLVSAAFLIAACASKPSQPFHPTGSLPAGAPGPGSSSSRPQADGLAWPPFGAQVHVIMPGWKPSKSREAAAVVVNKNFLLALLYAEYRGNQDSRWQAYVSPRLQPALKAQLAKPDVTTESFTGTIRFSHMSAFPDPTVKGALDVAQCFDNAKATNTSISTGRPIPDHTPASQHYYRTTNVLLPDQSGTWQVVAIYPTVYYPRAPECKP